jgi:TRAP-type C4-dicarboxylate transport system substrate-binding protein
LALILLMAPLLPDAHGPRQPNDKMQPMPLMHCSTPATVATPRRPLRVACRWASGLAMAFAAWAGTVQPAAATSDATTAKPMQLRIVGGLAGLTQYTQFEEPFWTQELPRLTQGQLRADIVPFNKAGLRTHEALRLIQLGVVPFGTVLLSGVLTTDPELAALDLAGLNPDMASLRRSLAAFRPHLEQTMRARHGIEVLAIYTYPPQITFCTKPFKGLSDLSGRRVRISNPTQADLLRPFGAIALQVEFSELMTNVRNGNVDCAITGGMTGNTIGLHTVTSHLHAGATTWGVSVFGANMAAWNALPAPVRDKLRAALHTLEASVWDDAEQQMRAGVACNTGQGSCQGGKAGQMTEVRTTEADNQKLREAFRTSVLPAWLQRCGDTCVPVWNRLMAPIVGIRATPPPNKP